MWWSGCSSLVHSPRKRCPECPYKTPVVPGYGDPEAEILIIGESPGKEEIRLGKPFVGRSGELLTEVLKFFLGGKLPRVFITNAVGCYPGEEVKKPLIRSCFPSLQEEIQALGLRPKKVLLLGASAAEAVFPKANFRKLLGMWRREENLFPGAWILTSYHPAAVLRNPDLGRDLLRDLQKFFATDGASPPPQVPWKVITQPGDVLTLLEEISKLPVLSCDIESEGFNPRIHKLLSIALSDGQRAWIVEREALEDPRAREALSSFLYSREAPLIFHNVKFDYSFLRPFFGWPPGKGIQNFEDTMLLAYLRDERGLSSEGGSAAKAIGMMDLKTLVRTFWDDDYGIKFEEVLEAHDQETLYAYQAKDAFYTFRLFFFLKRSLEEEDPGLLEAYKFLKEATSTLMRIEDFPIIMDLPLLRKIRELSAAKAEEFREELIAWCQARGLELKNPNSVPQVKKVLAKLGIDVPSTGKPELMGWLGWARARGESSSDRVTFVEKLLEFRKVEKLKAGFAKQLEDYLVPEGDQMVLYPDFSVVSADTGRLATHRPNLLNIPIIPYEGIPPIQDAFMAPQGFKLLAFDYSQLELRVAAVLSGDVELKRIFQEGKDLHREFASAYFRKPPEEIDPLARRAGKQITFGILYGRGAKSIAEGPEVAEMMAEGMQPWTVEEVEEFLRRFARRFSTLWSWFKRVEDQAIHEGVITTPFGRRKRFPYVDASSEAEFRRSARNFPIQSTASDLTLSRLIEISKGLDWSIARPILMIHDSILLYVREEVVEEIKAWVLKVMSTPPPQLADIWDIPLEVEVKEGYRWGSLK